MLSCDCNNCKVLRSAIEQCLHKSMLVIPVEDPGFPKEDVPTPRGKPTYYCMKMKFWPRGRGRVLTSPLDSSLDTF